MGGLRLETFVVSILIAILLLLLSRLEWVMVDTAGLKLGPIRVTWLDLWSKRCGIEIEIGTTIVYSRGF